MRTAVEVMAVVAELPLRKGDHKTAYSWYGVLEGKRGAELETHVVQDPRIIGCEARAAGFHTHLDGVSGVHRIRELMNSFP